MILARTLTPQQYWHRLIHGQHAWPIFWQQLQDRKNGVLTIAGVTWTFSKTHGGLFYVTAVFDQQCLYVMQQHPGTGTKHALREEELAQQGKHLFQVFTSLHEIGHPDWRRNRTWFGLLDPDLPSLYRAYSEEYE